MHNTSILLPALCVLAHCAFAQTPATFNWPGAAGSWTTAPWSKGSADHDYPAVAGDTARFNNGAVVTLDADVTVGRLDLTNQVNLVSDGTIRTLTFDSGTAGTEAVLWALTLKWDQPKISHIGSLYTDNALVLRLASPLFVNLAGNNSARDYLAIAARITGGTAESPCPIRANWAAGWGGGSLFLCNPANDFRGDLHISRSTTAGDRDVATLGAGYESVAFTDGLLGDPANEIWLDGDDALAYVMLAIHEGTSANPLNRVVHGKGCVKGKSLHEGYDNDRALYLGPHCVISPGSASAAGSILLGGSTVSTDPGTTLRLTLGTTFHDTVVFQPGTSSSFVGVVEFEDAGDMADIPGGTSLPLITATGNSFTFNPASTPAGWTFNTSGNSGSGWTVTATKIATFATVQTLPASLVGDTFATANARVIMPEAGPVATTARVYYGATDGGDDPSAWDAYADLAGTVNEDSDIEIPLTGFTLGGTYYYRFSVTSDGTTFLSEESSSFTTRELNVVNTFTWIATNDLWAVDGHWYIPTYHARRIPGVPGDTLVFSLDNGARTAYLESDASVGFINATLEGGYGTVATLAATSTPVTLTLDTGAEGTLARLYAGVSHHAGITFGTSGNNRLTLNLVSSPHIYADNSSGGCKVRVYSPVTGGTAERPVPIYISNDGNEWRTSQLYLESPASTFTGDIYVGGTAVTKGSSYLFVGMGNHPQNGMLGNPSNRIFLRNNAIVNYRAQNWGTPPAVDVERKFCGTGLVRTGDSTDNPTKFAPMRTTATAAFSPSGIDGTGFGTITLQAPSLTTDPGTAFEIDVAPDGSASDRIAITMASNDIVLNGTLAVRSDAHVPTGTQFTVVTVANTAAGFTNALSKAPGYTMTTVGNAEDGWSVVLTKNLDGTLIIVQ